MQTACAVTILVAAGLLSVVLFPPIALGLLRGADRAAMPPAAMVADPDAVTTPM